jgi:DNA-directed RNA polymerase specialized sigma24 family protein
MSDRQQSGEKFNSEVSRVLPRLQRYVAHRLRMAVIDGIIGPGKYRVEDITDEVFIRLKEEFASGGLELDKVKIVMFRLADRELTRILSEESAHGKDIPIEEILAEEMRGLEEKYSVAADGDIVLYEEFDDISYQHDREQKTIYLLEPGFENDLIKTLDLEESCAVAAAEARNLLAHACQKLPRIAGSIIALHVAGGLSPKEIAEVRDMDVQDVETIITRIRVRFTSVLTGAR